MDETKDLEINFEDAPQPAQPGAQVTAPQEPAPQAAPQVAGQASYTPQPAAQDWGTLEAHYQAKLEALQAKAEAYGGWTDELQREYYEAREKLLEARAARQAAEAARAEMLRVYQFQMLAANAAQRAMESIRSQTGLPDAFLQREVLPQLVQALSVDPTVAQGQRFNELVNFLSRYALGAWVSQQPTSVGNISVPKQQEIPQEWSGVPADIYQQAKELGLTPKEVRAIMDGVPVELWEE